ncbi:MAG: PHP domain-containing protein [Anaerolineaceae bacterium]
MIKPFKSDLHVHTVLSPCAEVEMIPPLIVEYALDLGINLIAITDHNASANIEAVQRAARNTPLHVFPGMELQTREEVHTLCLFDTLEQIMLLQKLVSETLPPIKNDAEHFGEQFVVDETGEFIRREEQLLLVSSSLSLNDAWKVVTSLGGLFIPAHVNRKAFGLLESLGIVPTDIQLEALEISKHINPSEAVIQFPQINGYPLIQDGDVHRLDEFNGKMTLYLEKPTIEEIRMAIHKTNNRLISFS